MSLMNGNMRKSGQVYGWFRSVRSTEHMHTVIAVRGLENGWGGFQLCCEALSLDVLYDTYLVPGRKVVNILATLAAPQPADIYCQ